MENKIVCADNLGFMRNIPQDSIDLVVTSPPYDSIRDYGGNWDIDFNKIGKEIFRILKDGRFACIVINDGTKNFRKSLTSFRLVLDWVDNCGFGLFETIIYSRNGRPGAWWNTRFRVDHEYIFLFFKGERPDSFDRNQLKIPAKHAGEVWHGTQRNTDGTLSKIKATKQKPTKCRGTIWPYKTSNTERNKTKMVHPATFPDKLAKDLILGFSVEGDLVFDPFNGSGTTCVEAKKLKRNYLGVDINKEYCGIAEKRLREEIQTSFVNGKV